MFPNQDLADSLIDSLVIGASVEIDLQFGLDMEPTFVNSSLPTPFVKM